MLAVLWRGCRRCGILPWPSGVQCPGQPLQWLQKKQRGSLGSLALLMARCGVHLGPSDDGRGGGRALGVPSTSPSGGPGRGLLGRGQQCHTAGVLPQRAPNHLPIRSPLLACGEDESQATRSLPGQPSRPPRQTLPGTFYWLVYSPSPNQPKALPRQEAGLLCLSMSSTQH